MAESQSAIDITTPEVLQSTGTTELATALSRALPSLNFPRPALTDGTSGIRPAQLRGLSPDQVLVLVNGERRHTSAMINVNGSIGRGSAAVDINAIPIAAIERVEALRDGASAQYGSDAIAGVVNIVLKGSGEGGSLAADYGQYRPATVPRSSSPATPASASPTGAASCTWPARSASRTRATCAGPYRGTTPNTGNFPDIGEKTFIVGYPRVDASAASANLGFAFSDNVSG